jgi:hypothetical protein
VSRAKPMGYNQRAENYFRQRGIALADGLFYTRFTPAQQHRAFKKERRSWRRLAASRV